MKLFGIILWRDKSRKPGQPNKGDPRPGEWYYHKDTDSFTDKDLLDYVIVQSVRKGRVMYKEIYRQDLGRVNPYQSCSIREFKYWFRKK